MIACTSVKLLQLSGHIKNQVKMHRMSQGFDDRHEGEEDCSGRGDVVVLISMAFLCLAFFGPYGKLTVFGVGRIHYQATTTA